MQRFYFDIMKKYNLKTPHQSSTPRLTNKITSLFCIIFLFLTLTSACKDKVKSGEVETKKEKISGVTLTTINPTIIDEVHNLTGTVKSRLSGVISSKVMGEVKEVYVKEGDFVKTGQILIKIDDVEINERVRAAEKGLESARHNKELAKKTYERYKALSDEKAVSGQELDQIHTQMMVAQAEYERAQAILNEAITFQKFTTIKAPYNGIITSKHIEKGNMAIVGAPLLSIEGTESYYTEVNVDESLLGIVKNGTPVSVYIESSRLELKTRVSEVVHSIDPKTRTFTVKIDLPSQNIKSGMFTKVNLISGKRESILIDKNSIVRKGQLTGTYAVDEKGVVSYRLIKLGKDFGNEIEVVSGIRPNDKIITKGIEKAFEGGIVEVASK